MRYIRYALIAAVAAVLITLSLANRGVVTLNTLPEGLADMPGMGAFAMSFELPLFLVVLGSLMLGLLIGEVDEYLREGKVRAEARRQKAELKKLQRELRKAQEERDKDKDEVLALLDQAS